MITTGDPAIAKNLRLLRQHGMSVNDLARHQSKTIVSESYAILGYNYRLTDVQASIGLGQLRRLDSIIARRREIAARYDAAFSQMQGIGVFVEPADRRWNHQTYLIRMHGRTATERDAFMQGLLTEGIASRRGIMSIHREAPYIARYGNLSFPESEKASDQCVCLPLYTTISDAEIEAVIDAVHRHSKAA
jgi:perosamine synthetase